MSEDGKPTNKGDGTGEADNPNSTDINNNKDSDKSNLNPLDEAKAINEKKEALLDREEKLQTRKEKLHAEQMVGGRAIAGQATGVPKEETPKAYHERVKKEMAAGKTDFGN